MAARSAAGRYALGLVTITGACAALAAQAPDNEAALAAKIAVCASCHGADGNSTLAGIPSLAGQPDKFLIDQLILIREGVRRSEVMRTQVRGLDDATITAIAKQFAAMTPQSTDGPTDSALAARGLEITKAGGCGGCHLPDYSGRAQIPRLAGQREDYLAATLTDYRDGKVSRPDTTMNDIMKGAPDEDIRALAHFFSRLEPRE